LEEETIEVTFESKSNQWKTKKNSSTGLTDAPGIEASDACRKFRRPVGLSLWMQAEIKSAITIAPVEPMVPRKAPVH
jgi:hypothetical protein